MHEIKSPSEFKSIFTINKKPIIPPVIDDELKIEIERIRELVKEKEERLKRRKAEKEIENQKILNKSTKDEDSIQQQQRERRLSYTLTSPIFEHDKLPIISSTENSESIELNKKSADDTLVDVLESIVISSDSETDEITFKSSKDVMNEMDKRSLNNSIVYEAEIEPIINNQLKELMDKQKREYLNAMEALKRKFDIEQEKLLNKIESNLIVTSTPMTNVSLMTTDDEEFTEFKTCLMSNENLFDLDEVTVRDEIEDESEKREKAATILTAFARGYLTRRLMKTIYVQEHIRNITETLQLALSLDDRSLKGSPVQNILLKAKLFRQLSTDLRNFNDIFFDTSTKEKMKIIASDREIKQKRIAEENHQNLSLSFQSVV